MVIFHSYVSLPEGTLNFQAISGMIPLLETVHRNGPHQALALDMLCCWFQSPAPGVTHHNQGLWRAYHPRSPWYLALIPSPSNQMEGMTSDRQTTCIQCKWKASATCRTGMTTHKKSGYESPAFTCYPGEDQNGMARNLSRRIFNIHKSPQLSLKPTPTAAILSLLVSTKTP
jgi:hypothetical protein